MDVIFDLDGTLADLTHRLHFIQKEPKDWTAFFAACPGDRVIEPVARIARLCSLGNRVIIASGRSDEVRAETEAWLQKMWGNGFSGYTALYMRKAGDHRPDDIIKEELLDQIIADGYRPELVFDDRDRVVAMWRRRGLICAQVADGEF